MAPILIVDDKEDNLYYLQALLTGHGFVVETARHGAEALFKARQKPPGLIISDLLMPVMDGYTLLRHWKSDTRLKHIPFIVYTATYTEVEDERLALSLGADAFILKPAEPEAFLSRIRGIQDQGAADASTLPRPPVGDETALLKVYSETLIRKLEEKTMQLEEVNRVLQEDIAERRLTEESLRESEERFRATFEHAAVGIAHVGLEGRFLRVNDKLCEITGYPREELLRRTFGELTAPEDRAESERARLAMLERRQAAFTAEKRYRRKSGEAVWVSVVTTLLRDEAGEPNYFITVLADITERKALEEQFLRSQRMESVGTLAGGIAHDLNNLLTPILMGVGLLKELALPPASQGVIGSIEQSARRGADLVKQVLSFSRGVEGARVAVHLGDVVREIENMVRNTFPKNIRLEINAPRELRLVMGDPTQLNQVLLNLCVNARDAMPEGGSLTLTVADADVDAQFAAMHRGMEEGRYVLLEVADTGCGMPPEVAERIFEPFYTTKELGKGTGLGLSTSLGIIRSHAGFVKVYSEPGKGSVFRVHLPAQAEGLAATPVEVPSEELPRGTGECILMVDDEAPILTVVRQTLESFGYRVLTAGDGADAMGLYALHRSEINLVLTDMMMPVMDGATFIAALRHLNPEVRVIATSGFNTSGAEVRAAGAGVKHFLTKPYSAERLLTLVKKVLTEKPTPAPPNPRGRYDSQAPFG